jgi:hypothetical protein
VDWESKDIAAGHKVELAVHGYTSTSKDLGPISGGVSLNVTGASNSVELTTLEFRVAETVKVEVKYENLLREFTLAAVNKHSVAATEIALCQGSAAEIISITGGSFGQGGYFLVDAKPIDNTTFPVGPDGSGHDLKFVVTDSCISENTVTVSVVTSVAKTL